MGKEDYSVMGVQSGMEIMALSDSELYDHIWPPPGMDKTPYSSSGLEISYTGFHKDCVHLRASSKMESLLCSVNQKPDIKQHQERKNKNPIFFLGSL